MDLRSLLRAQEKTSVQQMQPVVVQESSGRSSVPLPDLAPALIGEPGGSEPVGGFSLGGCCAAGGASGDALVVCCLCEDQEPYQWTTQHSRNPLVKLLTIAQPQFSVSPNNFSHWILRIPNTYQLRNPQISQAFRLLTLAHPLTVESPQTLHAPHASATTELFKLSEPFKLCILARPRISGSGSLVTIFKTALFSFC